MSQLMISWKALGHTHFLTIFHNLDIRDLYAPTWWRWYKFINIYYKFTFKYYVTFSFPKQFPLLFPSKSLILIKPFRFPFWVMFLSNYPIFPFIKLLFLILISHQENLGSRLLSRVLLLIWVWIGITLIMLVGFFPCRFLIMGLLLYRCAFIVFLFGNRLSGGNLNGL